MLRKMWVMDSPQGEGLGVRAKTLLQSGFHVKLTPMGTALPLQSVAFFFQIGIKKYTIAFLAGGE
ncbi:hypothetical protein NIES2107_56320 [Nostoc carneum NIES-2107]|nr:hypothetical protein NIES2107_56320 [Nostoc carneum NIES-2107]